MLELISKHQNFRIRSAGLKVSQGRHPVVYFLPHEAKYFTVAVLSCTSSTKCYNYVPSFLLHAVHSDAGFCASLVCLGGRTSLKCCKLLDFNFVNGLLALKLNIFQVCQWSDCSLHVNMKCSKRVKLKVNHFFLDSLLLR